MATAVHVRATSKTEVAQASPHLQKGDVELIKVDNEVRGQWKSGRVEQTYPGTDGLIRKVQIALAGKLDKKGRRVGPVQLLERPVQKLILLVSGLGRLGFMFYLSFYL